MKNYQQIKFEILNAVIGERNTSSLSHRMGFSFDKVKRWKNGSKQLHWNEFCDLCFSTQLPLTDILGFSLGALFETEKHAYEVVSYLKKFAKFDSVQDMANQLNISTATAQRYLSCKTFPEFEFILECIDFRPEFLDHFINNLKYWQPSDDDASVLTIPWATAVANAMSLPQHMSLPQYSPEWVANYLGISENQVKQAIDLLENIGLIELQGDHYGPTLSRTIAVRKEANKKDYFGFLLYWMDRSLERVRALSNVTKPKTSSDKDGFRVFACSPNAAKKISDILVKSEQEIHDLLQVDQDEKTEVRVYLYHHFSTTPTSSQ